MIRNIACCCRAGQSHRHCDGTAGRYGKDCGAVLVIVLVTLLAAGSLVLANAGKAYEEAVEAARLREEYRADLLAESGLDIALALLELDDTEGWDGPSDSWVKPWRRDNLTVVIEPANSRLNINRMNDRRTSTAVRSLILRQGLPSRLHTLLEDWLDEDTDGLLFGSEDKLYSGGWPGYRPRNGPLKTLDEVLLVAEWGEVDRGWLYRTFAVVGGAPNVNFIDKETFQTFLPELAVDWPLLRGARSPEGLRNITQIRDVFPALTFDDALYNRLLEQLSVETSAFRVSVEVNLPLVYEKRIYFITRDILDRKKPPEVMGCHVLETRRQGTPGEGEA